MEKRVRELPHDLLSEKSLIGCLILDATAFDEISDLAITREDFFHPQYGQVFEALKDLIMADQPVDFVTLCSKLNQTGHLESMGGESFITELIEEQASSANIYSYAKIVKDKSSLREIIKTAMRVTEMGMDYAGKTEDFFAEVESKFFSLTNEAKSGKMAKLNACLKDNLKALEDDSRKPGEISGLTTGYGKLDELLLGLQPGQLVVLAARPAMGKTAFVLNLALNSCEQSGLPVAVFSLEMVASELSMRMLTNRARVDSKRIRKKEFLDSDLRNIGSAVQKLSTLPVFINDSGSTSILDVQSQCRKIKAEQGLGLIIIDYLQLMQPTNKNLPREQQISEMSRGLKNMAKELGCPVLALSQLNRGVETRPDKRPKMGDLRESGAIEQDADIVMFIYRDEVYDPNTKEPGVAEIIVGKNRSGTIGTAKLAFVGAYASFENLSYDPPS